MIISRKVLSRQFNMV